MDVTVGVIPSGYIVTTTLTKEQDVIEMLARVYIELIKSTKHDAKTATFYIKGNKSHRYILEFDDRGLLVEKGPCDIHDPSPTHSYEYKWNGDKYVEYAKIDFSVARIWANGYIQSMARGGVQYTT